MRPSIDIAKELAFYCAGTYGTIAEMEELLALAINEARAEVIEAAAQYHDERAAYYEAKGTLRAGDIARSHRHSAAAIRALSPQRPADGPQATGTAPDSPQPLTGAHA